MPSSTTKLNASLPSGTLRIRLSHPVISNSLSFVGGIAHGEVFPSYPLPPQLLLAYAYGKPRDTASAEPMISMSEIEDARQSLEIKLQRIRESLESR